MGNTDVPWADGRARMPQPLRLARWGMFAQAMFTLVSALGLWLMAGSAMSGELLGEMAYASLPAVAGLLLCRATWRRGKRIPWLILAVQLWWLLRSLEWLADGSARGVTQLLLPVGIGLLVTRPDVRQWFALDPAERQERTPWWPDRPRGWRFSLPHMIRWRRDRGQSATEYVGILAVVVLIVGGIVGATVGTDITGKIGQQICKIGGGSCGEDGTGGDQPPVADGNGGANGSGGADGGTGTGGSDTGGSDGAGAGGTSDGATGGRSSGGADGSTGDTSAGATGGADGVAGGSGTTGGYDSGGGGSGNGGTGNGGDGDDKADDPWEPDWVKRAKDLKAGKGDDDGDDDKGCTDSIGSFLGCAKDGTKNAGKTIYNKGKEELTGIKDTGVALVKDPLGTIKNGGKQWANWWTGEVKNAWNGCSKGVTSCLKEGAKLTGPGAAYRTIVDKDARKAISEGRIGDAAGHILYNGGTAVAPFIRPLKALKYADKLGTAGKAGKAAEAAEKAAKKGDAKGARKAAEEAQKHADEAAKKVKGCSVSAGLRPSVDQPVAAGQGIGVRGSGTGVVAAPSRTVPVGFVTKKKCDASPEEIEEAQKAKEEADKAKAAAKEASRKEVAKWKKPSWHGGLQNPRAGTKDGGAGKWKSKRSVAYWPRMERWMRYQEQVSGVKRGKEYAIKDPRTGRDVDFDGWDGKAQMFKEAKFGYGKKVRANGTLEPAQADKFVEQAQRQQRAAGGKPIEWNFSNKRVADAAQKAFDDADVDVIVKHTPVRK